MPDIPQRVAERPERPPSAAVDPDAIRPGARLVGADLSGRDLSHANLAGADLSGADLSGARLIGADLTGATLFGAVLERTHLLGAALGGADLTQARARGAILGSARLEGAVLFDADLADATLTDASLRHADLRSARLGGARLRSADLTATEVRRADLGGADLTGAAVGSADFGEASLRGARLRGITGFTTATWVGVDISDVDFTGAYSLRRTILDENYLHEFRTTSRTNALVYAVWKATSDCGRSLTRWAALTCAVALLFGGAYTQVTLDYGDHQTALSPFYFSVVTLTTLGYGDVLPASLGAQVVVLAEVLTGYLMLGGLLSIFATKMGRRAE